MNIWKPLSHCQSVPNLFFGQLGKSGFVNFTYAPHKIEYFVILISLALLVFISISGLLTKHRDFFLAFEIRLTYFSEVLSFDFIINCRHNILKLTSNSGLCFGVMQKPCLRKKLKLYR